MKTFTNYQAAKTAAINTPAFIAVLAKSVHDTEWVVPTNEKEQGSLIQQGYKPV